MAKEINIAQNITSLRKKHNLTQEQLAEAIKVSPQAVSKWETASCNPDTSTLPMLADFFGVSIDYLFYGYEETNNSIYEKVADWVCAQDVKTEAPFEEALKLSAAAQHGISLGYTVDPEWSKKYGNVPIVHGLPFHLTDIHGISVSSQKGFSAIVTDDFVNSINGKTMKRANWIFKALANEDCLRVTVEILNCQGISWLELKEKTGMDEDRLKNAVEEGKNVGFIEEKRSIYDISESEYFIQRHHYNCLCIILSSVRMIELSLRGATRMMRFPGFAMSFEEDGDKHSDDKGNQ